MSGPAPLPTDLIKAAEQMAEGSATQAQAVLDNIQRRGLSWELTPATVQGSGTRMVSILYDGDSVAITAISLVGPLVTGVRVYAIHIPPSGNFIIGFATKPDFVDGVNVTTTGALIAGVSAETDIPQLALSGAVRNGYTYLIEVQIIDTVTATSDDWLMNVRRDTATTGTIISRASWSGDNIIGTHRFTWLFTATVDETLSLFFSIARTAGAGTIAVFGAEVGSINRTMSYLALCSPASLWRTA